MSKKNNRRNTSSAPATVEKPRRIRLFDGRSAFLTVLLIVVCLTSLILMETWGWFDNILGTLLLLAIAFFTCALIFDVGLIFSACVTIADGAVNAGKDKEGKLILFHCSSVERMELRDAKTDAVIPEDKKCYRKVRLTFVMESGRINQRETNYITQHQLNALRREIMGK